MLTQLSRELLPLLLAAIGLSALYGAAGKPVQVSVDGEQQLIHTHSRQVLQVLSEAGIALSTYDWVFPDREMDLTWSGDQAPVVTVQRARRLSLAAGNQQLTMQVPELPAGNLLSLAGWMTYPGDRLEVDGIPAGSAVELPVEYTLALRRGNEVMVFDDGARRVLYSAAPTVGAALAEAGIELREGDRITLPLETALDGPLSVRIDRSRPIVIQTGSASVHSWSAAATIAGALAEAGIPLVGLDYTVPSAEGPLPEDGVVRLVRVTESVTLEQEPLPYETQYQPLDSLEIDQSQIVQAGAYGVRTNRVRVRYEDGEEVDRFVEGDWIAQEPTPQIVGYGTHIEIRTIATDDGTIEYWRAVEMYATSYSPSRAGVSPDAPWFGITASGKPLVKGLVAIDRSLIPFGTMMYVPGYGFAEAADTGSGVKGRWIDLGYEDDNWVGWSGYVTVYFLTPVPSNIVYVFP